MGFDQYTHTKAQKFVADKWNISVLRVAGNSVERKLADSVIVENSCLWRKLDKTLKIDSKKQFRDEVTNEIKKIIIAEKLIKSDKKVKRIRRKIENRKIETYIGLDSKKNEWTYVYTIYTSLKKDYTDNPKQTEFYFSVNVKNGITEREKPDANKT